MQAQSHVTSSEQDLRAAWPSRGCNLLMPVVSLPNAIHVSRWRSSPSGENASGTGNCAMNGSHPAIRRHAVYAES